MGHGLLPPRELLIALNASPDLRRDAICRLARDLDCWSGSKKDAERAPSLLRLSPRDVRTARSLLPGAPARAARELETARRRGVTVLTLLDPAYPAPLLDLPLPPPVLYRMGAWRGGPAVAIVGARRADAYGREVARRFARELASTGLTVVSGFARGVDGAAHRGALEAPGGRTVAVLGCGLDVDYPRGRRRLRERLLERGSLLTEHPLGDPPRARNFPVRNRIIAALALGTLVVQARARSGSLITARLALDLGRDVYAVPGRIFEPLASGPNALIRDGALLAARPLDILESLPTRVREGLRPPTSREVRPPNATSATAHAVFALLEPGRPSSVDALARRLSRPSAEVLAALLELEVEACVRRLAGGAYCRRA